MSKNPLEVEDQFQSDDEIRNDNAAAEDDAVGGGFGVEDENAQQSKDLGFSPLNRADLGTVSSEPPPKFTDQDAEYWQYKGFAEGYNNAGSASPPLVLSPEASSAYQSGIDAANEALMTITDRASEYGGPSVNGPRDGISIEEWQESTKQILEGILHKHMPHIDPEEVEIEFD